MTGPVGKGLAVDPAMLDQLAGRVDTVKDDVDGILKRVQGIADQLANPAVWSGQGQVRFAQVSTEWQQNSAKLNAALLGISQGLRSNRSGLETADQDAGARLGRVDTGGSLNIPG
ncbi:WXG100 family type VII secretion target [Dietzia sp. 179-F 9C3 NHS]|uniref:WXG100 family type VII secretion target n=1 Tax=Dietzia sp. 179-F 9C3 NHS TaxID=3374295 RepID=UPI0038790B40